MQSEDFTLKSGTVLHLSSGPWDKVVALWSVVKMVTIGKRDNPEIGHILLASADVQAAVRDLFPNATYKNVKVYQGLFDEQKMGEQARTDYLEICEKIIEFQLRPFFLTSSSSSTEPKVATTKDPGSQ